MEQTEEAGKAKEVSLCAAPVEISHPRVTIETFDEGQGAGKETIEACRYVLEALKLRQKYLFVPRDPSDTDDVRPPFSPLISFFFFFFFFLLCVQHFILVLTTIK